MPRSTNKDGQKSLPIRFKNFWNALRTENSCNQFYSNNEIGENCNCVSYGSHSSSLQNDSASSLDEDSITLNEKSSESFHPINPDWLKELTQFIDKYYKKDKRNDIRIRALDILSVVFNNHRYTHEESLIDAIVMPFLRDIDEEQDYCVRNKGVQFLLDLTSVCSNSKRSLNILEIIDKILNRPIEKLKAVKEEANDNYSTLIDEDIIDLKTIVCGLIELIEEKMWEMSQGITVEAFNLLVSHINAHYKYGLVSNLNSLPIREKIINFLLSFRVKESGRIGLMGKKPNEVRYSPYLYYKSSNGSLENSFDSQSFSNNVSPLQTQTSSFSSNKIYHNSLFLAEIFPIILSALSLEKEWSIFKLIFQRLPSLLNSRVLIHHTSSRKINDLVLKLDSMIGSVDFHKKITNAPEDFKKTTFQSYIFPILSSLVTHHKFIDQSNQSLIVKCLAQGLPSRPSTCFCISALTLCAIEMQDTMIKLLPGVLLDLSKISASVTIAVSFLEFLSYLSLAPRLYASFVPDQYMSIFATVLPYTNPSKFSDYIVAMAYKVMSTWFLKCHLPFRKIFNEYIIRNLQVNVIQPLEESINQEENKKRSGSFNSESTSKNLESYTLSNNPCSTSLAHSNEKFHIELVESYMDLLSRYTSGFCSTTPATISGQDFVLNRGSSSTWLMGLRLITITTSGCKAKPFIDGLCEKCYRLCKSFSTQSDSRNDEISNIVRNNFTQDCELFLNEFANGEKNNLSSRRRHQSAFTPNLSNVVPKPTSRAYDDFHLRFSSFNQPSDDSEELNTCNCWCEGWAEIVIRRVSGSTSWKMKLQNSLNVLSYPKNGFDPLFPDLTPIYPSRSFKNDLDDLEEPFVQGEDLLSNLESQSNNSKPDSSPPVFRRISSSPEIEKGEFMETFKKNKNENVIEKINFSNEETSGIKVSRASSLGRGDFVNKCSNFTRSSFNWKTSPSKYRKADIQSPSSESGKKENFFNHDLKLDLKSDNCFNESSQSSSPSKPSNSSSNILTNMRTPPKTPSKLENISENFSHAPRGRLATISVMSPALVGPSPQTQFRRASSNQRITILSNLRNDGIKPSFIFLQLFYNPSTGAGSNPNETPLLLPKIDKIKNAINNLDRILPHEVHKIGVIFIDKNQAKNISAILSNRYGSVRYANFLKGLGNLIQLKNVDPLKCYIGGLAQNEQDGKFAYNWQDNLTQVIFHVSTLMPNKENDPECKSKIAHIGNDCVCIIYNNSEQDLDITNFKFGKFLIVAIVITPQNYDCNQVSVHLLDEGLSEIIGPRDEIMLSDFALSGFVRQLSLHLNIASLIYHSKKSVSSGSLYASNCVERLRQIERIRQKIIEYNKVDPEKSGSDDFFSSYSNLKSNIDIEESCFNSINCDDFTKYI